MPRTHKLPDLFKEQSSGDGIRPDSENVSGLSLKFFTRRKFLRKIAGATSLTALVGVGYAWRIEPVWPEIAQLDMPIPDLPLEFVGFRIIQLSDLHVSPSMSMSYLAKWVDWVNRRKADLVVVTGDLVQHGQPEWADSASRLLAGVQAAEGVLTILGNHDWGTYRMGKGYDWMAGAIAAAMAERGVRVLRNESVAIRRGQARLHIVGLDDYWGDWFDPDKAFAGIDGSEPCISLVHNPDGFVEMLDFPASWTLAGHTHGGQVSIPFIGPIINPVRHKQFVAGHYQMAGKNLYINRGLGWYMRIRFNARPEITEFTLCRA